MTTGCADGGGSKGAARAACDMVGRPSGYLLWGVPLATILAGTLAAPFVRTLAWSPAFLVMGVACLANAARCGRRHCFFTGPLYLAAAVASVLVGLGAVSWSWGWIGWGALLGTVLAHVPEWIRGRYVRGVGATG